MADIRNVTKVEGTQTSDQPVSDNPVFVGGRASDAVVTPVSGDGDAVGLWLSRRGAVFVSDLPHVGIDGTPFSQVNAAAQYGGAQTGVAVVTPGSGKKIVLLSYDITVVGTASSDAVLWYGASADTTFTIGTDSAAFYGNFIPSASISPGVSRSGVWISPTADHRLRFTAPGANTYYVSVWYYEI